MNTLSFLIEKLEEIRPGIFTENMPLDFIDLTFRQFEKLQNAVKSKYSVRIESKHMYQCVGVVELSKAIDLLIKYKSDDLNGFMLYNLKKDR